MASKSLVWFLFAGGLAAQQLTLDDHWVIQSSAKAGAAGEAISKPGFAAADWYETSVPSTVVSALVARGVYPDPYFGMNLRSIPGTSYPIAENFSNLPMPADSPFARSWWYRTEFQLSEEYKGKTIWLHFGGINYRANVWLNGRQVASSEKMAGAWRLFDYNVTAMAQAGAMNALAVEVIPPGPKDLAITFVDWNPLPSDKGMGLWREVTVRATGPVALRFPQVITKLAGNGAALTVTAELHNGTDAAVEGTLKGEIEGLRFSQPVRLAANETRVAVFPEVKLENPRLWWPAQVGAQHLYPLHLELEAGGGISDQLSTRFGIREITSRVDEQGHRVFQINGKNILIRGAGYTFDMLLRSSRERQRAELEYVRDMNLNAVRLEGKLENESFLDLTDEMGILVFAGWCCCDHWEKWGRWKPEDQPIAVESLKDQIRRLRNHPSLANWMNGSDNPPPPAVEKAYIQVLKDYNWPNPYESSATEKATPVTGTTGVKMRGPYEYIAPSYWLLDKKLGGAHGFATEIGPGPAVPPIESLRRMLPAEHLWPIDAWWNYHCGGGPFKDLHVFTQALEARYGAASGVEDYAMKAQVLAYEGHRAMFEAFGRNKYTSTGVIQWMLNNAWPSNIWHLYDWYLRPGGSYFGAKKANEPLHVQYSYDDGSVVVVNSFYRAFPGMKVSARVLNLDMSEKFAKDATIDVGPDSSTRVLTIPAIEGLSTTYFVRLELADGAGKAVSSNFYWLSTRADELDWGHSDWYHTPTKTFADLSGLATLPKVELTVAAVSDGAGRTRVTVENPSRALAFAVRLKVNRPGDGEEILPVLWQDNYFSLLPGEKREITATYRYSGQPVVEVSGWNVR